MELLTVKETAKMLKVSQMTVRRYIASGKLKAVRVGRNIRIRRVDAEGIATPVVPRSEERMLGSGKPLDYDSPLWDLVGLIEDDGPADYSINADKYLAETYAETNEDEITRGVTEKDIISTVERHIGTPLDAAALERLRTHPYMKLIGLVKGEGPDDYSINHDKYLADEAADTHEE